MKLHKATKWHNRTKTKNLRVNKSPLISTIKIIIHIGHNQDFHSIIDDLRSVKMAITLDLSLFSYASFFFFHFSPHLWKLKFRSFFVVKWNKVLENQNHKLGMTYLRDCFILGRRVKIRFTSSKNFLSTCIIISIAKPTLFCVLF